MSDNDFHEFTHPETGEIHKLRRVSSFADMLDKYMLRQWQMKTVAHAVATHNHLQALASMWDTCGDAVKEALAYKPEANMGTAGHKAADLLDDGKVTVDGLTHPDVRDIATRYERLMAEYPLRPVMSEQRVFNLTVGYIGHFDRIWEVVEDFTMHGWKFVTGELIVGDMKTGNFLDNEICLQQAGYVNAEGIISPDRESLIPMPDVRKDVAFIIHVPQSKDNADLIPIRLEGAWEAFIGLAVLHQWNAVRLKIPTELRRSQERKIVSGGASTREDEVAPAVVPRTAAVANASTDTIVAGGEQVPDSMPVEPATPGDVDHRNALIARVKDLTDEQREEMARRWPLGIPTFRAFDGHSDIELDLIELVLGGIDLGGAVGPIELPPEPPPQPAPVPLEWVEPDSERLTEEAYEAVKGMFEAQPADVVSLVTQWAMEAHTAGRAFTPRDKRTERRAAILTAAVGCAAEIADLDVVRAVIGWVMDRLMIQHDDLGWYFGSMTLDEARRVALFAEHFGRDIALEYDEEGAHFTGDGLAAVAA